MARFAPKHVAWYQRNRQFSALVRNLHDGATDRINNLALIDYFKEADQTDVLWAIYLLLGNRPGRAIANSILREWAVEEMELPTWLFEESLKVSGDLAETIAILLPYDDQTHNISLSKVVRGLKHLGSLEITQKQQYVNKIWKVLDVEGKYIFNKLLTGGFRTTVSIKLIALSLSSLLNIDKSIIAHRLTSPWAPGEISFAQLFLHADDTDSLSKAYPFHLARPLDKILPDLGHPSDWSIEWKWDGIRAQMIIRNKEIFLWSRGEELISNRFPEFKLLLDGGLDNIVLDGEIVPFKNGMPLPFGSLQKRMNRKAVGKKLMVEIPILFICYDILEHCGQDIRAISFAERRIRLESVLETEENLHHLALSEKIDFQNWDELSDCISNARKKGAEGFMLKKLVSPYGEGRQKGDWWKWKVDALNIDAVLLYATRSQGFGAVFSEFTFAVWNGENLVPVAKVKTGLDNETINEITTFVKENTIEKFGPVFSVKPELVFEITFEGIYLSKRHKCGVALRSPSILRKRFDKKADEANTLEDLHSLLKIYLPNE